MSLTKIDLGISIAGHGPNKKDQRYIHITRKSVIERVKNHPAIDLWTKEYLYKRINDYPDSALVFFVQNINEIVINAINERNRVMKEQYDENRKEIEPILNQVTVSEIGESSELQQPSGGERGTGVGEVEAKEEAEATEKDRESLFSRSSG